LSHRTNKSYPFAPTKTTETKHGYVRLTRPGWLELGSEGDDEQHRQAYHSLDRHVQQLARAGIDPVYVFVDHDHRE
jgi:hypothetical protein